MPGLMCKTTTKGHANAGKQHARSGPVLLGIAFCTTTRVCVCASHRSPRNGTLARSLLQNVRCSYELLAYVEAKGLNLVWSPGCFQIWLRWWVLKGSHQHHTRRRLLCLSPFPRAMDQIKSDLSLCLDNTLKFLEFPCINYFQPAIWKIFSTCTSLNSPNIGESYNRLYLLPRPNDKNPLLPPQIIQPKHPPSKKPDQPPFALLFFCPGPPIHLLQGFVKGECRASVHVQLEVATRTQKVEDTFGTITSSRVVNSVSGYLRGTPPTQLTVTNWRWKKGNSLLEMVHTPDGDWHPEFTLTKTSFSKNHATK